ncbi:MAG: hypothetical protein COV37_15920 [Bdellovibrio sp. CG11_big_fil_rev_8_21_14_0_20_39_38]|nr:MAG: hypothetical protein COW78_15770 [Bdellovibrio sp. CG22_combo_CG10-13_8_21_14_all_39_27]PIR33547.1 MAG: hypothetical protein COV37_15920 [Bdellovibrio sp. CG11_big_fil_rev_8_21_14_0_20_39_38]
MSIDYNRLFKEQATAQRFKEWVEFWDLGEIDNPDSEINHCIESIKTEVYDKKVLRYLALNAQDKIEDLISFIDESNEVVIQEKLFEYILKFEKSWSRFKTKTIIEDDDFFGMLLKRLSTLDSNIEKSQSEEQE